MVRAVGLDLGRAARLGAETAARSAAGKLTAKRRAPLRGDPPLALSDVLTVDNRGWFAADESPDVASLARDLRLARRLRIRYRHSGAAESQVYVVDPYGLLLRADRWYLIADSESRPRMYALTRLERASAIPVLSGLQEIHRGYVEADRLMGAMCLTGPITLQMPLVERACEVSRGADRAEMLQFACRFMEFGGWLFQDAGDLACAMHWTDRALDYALELGDRQVIAYTLMRKGLIATESGHPAQGVGIANSALEYKGALTPRLRAVILRQRSYSNAALGEVLASARDSDEAVAEAVASERRGEEDRAPYCTPAYVAMEAGARGPAGSSLGGLS